MRTGRLWRGSNRGLAVVATVVGLIVFGPGATSRGADEKDAGATKGSASKAKLDLIDQHLKEAWDQASIKPSTMSTDIRAEEEFVRRAYLDIIGRIPNIQEASAYLTEKEKG